MPICPCSRGSKIRGKIHGPAKRPGRTPSLQAMALAQKDQLLEIGPGAAVRQAHQLPGVERSRRRTACFTARPQTRGYAPLAARLRRRNPNKSSLHDVMQNRRRARGFPQTFFQVDDGGAGRDRTDDPLLAKQVLSQLSYGPSLSSLRRRRRPPSPRLARHRARRPVGLADASHPTGANPPTWQLNMVGLGGLEPPTSRLSSARSNQLSYKPVQSTRRRPAPRGEASQGRPTVGAPAPPTLKPWPDRAAHAGASIIHEERETKAAGAALVKAMAK